jgi:O104-antigen biosynthesis beta-1,3-galactosyltransferase
MSFLMVISPTDNESLFIKCLNSIVAQTYGDFFLTIVINGGNSQRIANLVKNSIKNSAITPRMIESPQILNLGPALNLGLEKIVEDITIRIDPDDICLPKRLELIQEELALNDFDIMGSQIYEFECKNNHLYERKYPTTTVEIQKRMLWNNQIAHPSVVFKTRKILDIGGYPDIYKHEDYALWLKCIKNNYILQNSTNFHVLMNITDLHKRRGGFKTIYGEYLISLYKYQSRLYPFLKILLSFILRVCYRLSPTIVKKYLHLNLRKTLTFQSLEELILKESSS